MDEEENYGEEENNEEEEDFCAENGWYGDEICDEFCAQPDPDCGMDEEENYEEETQEELAPVVLEQRSGRLCVAGMYRGGRGGGAPECPPT